MPLAFSLRYEGDLLQIYERAESAVRLDYLCTSERSEQRLQFYPTHILYNSSHILSLVSTSFLYTYFIFYYIYFLLFPSFLSDIGTHVAPYFAELVLFV